MMSNMINGSEPVRAALHKMQKEVCGKIMAIRTHCPTRFAILHLINGDLLASEQPIRRMVAERDWPDVSASCAHADEFTFAATVSPARGRAPAYHFFREAELLAALVQPISDAIHQLEADKPLLSQVYPIWKQLLAHAGAFDGEHAGEGREPVLPLFERRYKVHRDKLMPTAWVLDPIYWELDGGEWFLPFSKLKQFEFEAVKKCLVQLGGVENEAAILQELTELKLGALDPELCDDLPVLTKRTTLESGKVTIAAARMRRGWWQTCGRAKFPHISKTAVRLLSCHVTACSSERNWSLWGRVYPKCRSRLALERGGKLVYIAGNDDSKEKITADEEVVLAALESA
jgi:hypothetical protein